MSDKPNKPRDVVEHQHFDVHGHGAIGDQDTGDARFDACRLADGTCGVWDVERDLWTVLPSYEMALRSAAIWAKLASAPRIPLVTLRLERPNVDFVWVQGGANPLMLDVPSEECHPIRMLDREEVRRLRDWLTERLGESNAS